MKTLVPGHRYELEQTATTGRPTPTPCILQFIHKEPGPEGLVTFMEGTTNEEVCRVLIDRLNFLHEKLPSPYTRLARESIEVALDALETRTSQRVRAGVEGTMASGPTNENPFPGRDRPAIEEVVELDQVDTAAVSETIVLEKIQLLAGKSEGGSLCASKITT